MKRSGLLLLHLLLSGTVAVATAATDPTNFQPPAAAIRAHMRFLADDLLEGRETGSRGEALAALYIASQFESSGLTPGGAPGSYFQSVPLMQSIASNPSGFSVSSKGLAVQKLLFGEDFLPVASFTHPQEHISAAAAFVGFGAVAPEQGIDAYAGLDVRGKVVLALSGAPSGWPTEERAFYSSTALKREEAAKHGAVALVILYTPTAERLTPFTRAAKRWDEARATWRSSSGLPFAPGVPQIAVLSLSGGRKLLTGAPMSFDALMDEVEHNGTNVRSFNLPMTVIVHTRSRISPIHGTNVIGIVPGSDPVLKDQFVVVTAHYDHLGLKKAATGNQIYHGALDNAAGVAILLETARGFMLSGQRPHRSLLFTIVTAEEKGLIGSDYFARNPTVPRESMIADLNVDMPLLTYEFSDIVAFGGTHSSLGPTVATAAAAEGIGSSPDPVPDQAVFIRSDHFRFVQQGIPSISLATGFGGPGRAAYEDFLEHRYHQPSDDLGQAIDYNAGVKFAALVHDIIASIANSPEPPRWNTGDFFGAKFHR